MADRPNKFDRASIDSVMAELAGSGAPGLPSDSVNNEHGESREPQNASHHIRRGVQLSSQGQYEQAISEFNQAIQLDPRSARAFNNRGDAYFSLHKYERAINDSI